MDIVWENLKTAERRIEIFFVIFCTSFLIFDNFFEYFW